MRFIQAGDHLKSDEYGANTCKTRVHANFYVGGETVETESRVIAVDGVKCGAMVLSKHVRVCGRGGHWSIRHSNADMSLHSIDIFKS
jgi:hypothetical protein